jgi:serine/arginine repetitive matrix protein 2
MGLARSIANTRHAVLGIESLSLPLPSQDTSFCVTLDNGIDYIRTPYTTLKEGARINQEFAL